MKARVQDDMAWWSSAQLREELWLVWEVFDPYYWGA
jgi:hypothetical protein